MVEFQNLEKWAEDKIAEISDRLKALETEKVRPKGWLERKFGIELDEVPRPTISLSLEDSTMCQFLILGELRRIRNVLEKTGDGSP